MTFNLGEWNNITYVVDGNNGSIEVYLNGINDPGSSRSFYPNETYYNENRIWQMGAITWDAPHWMEGQLDNISIRFPICAISKHMQRNNSNDASLYTNHIIFHVDFESAQFLHLRREIILMRLQLGRNKRNTASISIQL